MKLGTEDDLIGRLWSVDLERLYILRHRKDKETIGFRIPNFLLEAAIQL